MKKNESLWSAYGISIIEICLKCWQTLQCTYGCGRNTIGYLAINVLIKSNNIFMIKASAFSSIFSTFTCCTAKIMLFF